MPEYRIDPFARTTPLTILEAAELRELERRWFAGGKEHLSPSETCWALTLAFRALATAQGELALDRP